MSWSVGSPPSSRGGIASPRLLLPSLAAAAVATAAAAQHPFAASVVSYSPGAGVNPAYANPLVALGEPSRFTADPLWPAAVTPFQSPYLPSQVVQVGPGGSLTVAFDPPIVDDPRHPFGIDLIVFGNAFFLDAAYPSGVVGGVYSEGGIIELSEDGVAFTPVKGIEADGLFPTMGWLDVGPFAAAPGQQPTDFTRPVDPLAAAVVLGANYETLLEIYGGSGGGAPVDVAAAGLATVRFVRIRVPLDAGEVIEIDAFSSVTPQGSPADLDGDGSVGGGDLALLLQAWGGCPRSSPCPADLDGNGVVDGADLALLLAAWSS
jgi:hypothetical protein